MSVSLYLEKTVDLIREGLIVVDKEGTIRVYNQTAREVFGIDPNTGPGHPEGRAEREDIVALADSELGADDGQLVPADLAEIGVEPRGLQPGMAVVAIGKKGAPPGTAVVAYRPQDELAAAGQVLRVAATYPGVPPIEALVDHARKHLTISVGDETFDFFFELCAGHLVVVDGASHRVKFYQTRGYTARGEDARHIILGRSYMRKAPGAFIPRIVGRPLWEIHPASVGTELITQVLEGKVSSIPPRESIINGKPVRCCVMPLKKGKEIIAAALVVEDLRELKQISWERDRAVGHLAELEKVLRLSTARSDAFRPIVGHSEALMNALDLAQRAARTSSTVLLLGESGTGKSLFARCIHLASRRRDGPFVHISCAALPPSLLESELFGYEEGAFTGACRGGKPGKFELANHGTIFLDEVGDLDPSVQAKLLYVLQEETVQRLGARQPTKIDVRVIAATNRDLEEEVRKGGFREDLFYRLNVVTINVPPLRERREDLEELVDALLPELCRRTGRPNMVVSPAVRALLRAYDWPGNIRELENVLERAVNLADEEITPRHLPEGVRRAGIRADERAVTVRGAVKLRRAVEEAEQQALLSSLEAAGWNRTKAMKILEVGRTAFYKKMRKYRLTGKWRPP